MDGQSLAQPSAWNKEQPKEGARRERERQHAFRYTLAVPTVLCCNSRLRGLRPAYESWFLL